MEYTQKEYLALAGIGKTWIFYCENGSQMRGIMSGISDERITCRVDGQEKSLNWGEIDLIRAELPPVLEDPSDFKQWIKQIDCMVKGPAFRQIFNLSYCYRALFDRLGAYDTYPVLQDILRAKTQKMRRRLYIRDTWELQICLRELDRVLVLEHASREERAAARSLVYLIAKEYISALNELLPDAVSSDPAANRILLPLACFYHEIRDSAGAFFWLMRCFAQEAAPVREDSPLWWGYLQYAVIHNYFPQVWEQIQRLYQSNVSLALRSMAFLFLQQGNRCKGELLYTASCHPSPCMSMGTLQSFYSALTHNAAAEEYSSRFYRYYLQANQILRDGSYRPYEKDEHLQGYVCDFVDMRGFCLVLGLDLMTYFLHFDDGSSANDNFTPAIRKKLRQEINASHFIYEETPVRVSFTRSRMTGPEKRFYSITYAALDIGRAEEY